MINTNNDIVISFNSLNYNIFSLNQNINITSNQSSVGQNETKSILYKTLVGSLTILIFILTAAGNGIILITIKCQARLLSSNSNYLNSNYFILNLAIADLFVSLMVMPLMIVYTFNHSKWIFNQTLCDSWMAFDFLCSSASFLTLSAMSIERYKMLTSSYMRIENSSKYRIIFFVCLSWLLPLISWIPLIIVYRVVNRDQNKTGECFLSANKYIILIFCILLYHVPLLFMVTFYTKLIIFIKKTSSNNLENCFNNPILMNYHRHSLCLSQSIRNFRLNDTNTKNECLQRQTAEKNNNESIEMNSKKLKYNSVPFDIKKNYLDFSSTAYIEYLENLTGFEKQIFKKNSLLSHSNKSDMIIQFSSVNLPYCNKSCRMNKFNKQKNNQLNKIYFHSASECYSNAKNDLNSKNSDFRQSVPNNSFKFGIDSESHSLTYLKQEHQQQYTQNHDESLKNFFKSNYNSNTANSELNKCETDPNKSRLFARFSSFNKRDVKCALEDNCIVHYQNLRLKRNRKAARMLGLLVSAFLICWFPFSICYPLGQFYPNLFSSHVNILIWWMGYLNSTINPFLYVYSNKTIRRSVRDLFYKRFWQFFIRSHSVDKNFRHNSLKHNCIQTNELEAGLIKAADHTTKANGVYFYKTGSKKSLPVSRQLRLRKDYG